MHCCCACCLLDIQHHTQTQTQEQQGEGVSACVVVAEHTALHLQVARPPRGAAALAHTRHGATTRERAPQNILHWVQQGTFTMELAAAGDKHCMRWVCTPHDNKQRLRPPHKSQHPSHHCHDCVVTYCGRCSSSSHAQRQPAPNTAATVELQPRNCSEAQRCLRPRKTRSTPTIHHVHVKQHAVCSLPL
jgi:hypothetical protein